VLVFAVRQRGVVEDPAGDVLDPFGVEADPRSSLLWDVADCRLLREAELAAEWDAAGELRDLALVADAGRARLGAAVDFGWLCGPKVVGMSAPKGVELFLT
jgi:hypothetical protein